MNKIIFILSVVATGLAVWIGMGAPIPTWEEFGKVFANLIYLLGR